MVLDRPTQGSLRTADGRPLPLERTAVRGRIQGPVADVAIEQRFRNDTGEPIEAVYLFPLPHGASVHTMAFRIGGRTVTAVVKEKEEAKRTYEKARAEGRAATLLEEDKPGLFTLSVANVPPGEAIDVTLAYQETIGFDDGEWRFVFPMVAEERWEGAPTGAPAEGMGAVRPPRPKSDRRPADVTLEIEIHAARALQAPRSPSHRVVSEPAGENAWKVRLAETDAMPNRDFVLAFRAAERGVRPEVWFEREKGRPGSFLLVVTPPAPEPPDAPAAAALGGKAGEGRPVLCGNCGGAVRELGEIREVAGLGPAWRCTWCGVVAAMTPKGDERRVGLPRDVVFLVDRSASMRQGSVAQARRAVRLVMDHLGPNDAVQVIAFDHERTAVDEGAPYLPIGADTQKRVDAFLAALAPRGGSELEAALERAAKIPRRKDRAKLVVLLTDAAVGDEARLLRRVPEILGEDTRLYVLGVGPAVHRWLVERLARMGGGASDVLLPSEDVETVVTRFARRVRHGGPVLRVIRLAWDDALSADIYPSPMPDLFGGQPVELVGRFSGTGPSRLVLTAETAAGEPFRQEIDVTLPAASSNLPGLERIWARRRIDARLDRLLAEPGAAGDVRVEVVGLALKHALVTPYTSLVAEDSERSVEGKAKRVEMAAVPPAAPPPGGAPMAAGPAPGAPLAMPAMALGRMPPAPARSAPVDEESTRASSVMERPRATSPVAPGAPKGASGFRGMVDRVLGRGQEGEDSGASLTSPDTEAYSKEELAWAKSRRVGELDLVFLVDETGSMGAYIAQVQQHLLAIIDALRKAPLCKSMRLGLVSYRDHPPQDPTFASRVVPLTEDIKAIREGVERMSASGGGDGPESVTDGLYDLVRLDWRPGAARVVVWVGDAPPHGVGEPGDAFPKGCPCGHHWATQAESCREMGIVVHAVGCLPGLRGFAMGEAVFKSVAKTARGLYLPLANAPLLIPLITGVAETELDKQRIEERIADALAEHDAILQPADDQERVRYLTDVLRQSHIRPRTLAYGAQTQAPPPLRFREITPADVQEGLDQLRRLGRTTL